jgi:predicted metalloprotease with PDZ domain
MTNVRVQVPTEQTCTFRKGSMGTVCGISFLKNESTNNKTTVMMLDPNGAAAGCGLQVGDVLLSINGMRVTSPDQGATLLKSIEGEVKVRVTRPLAEPSMVQVPTEQTYTFRKATGGTVCGISLLNGLQAGHQVVGIESLDAGGAASGCGLAVGDAVVSINGMRVTSQDQGATLLKSVEGEVKVRVTRLVAVSLDQDSARSSSESSLRF